MRDILARFQEAVDTGDLETARELAAQIDDCIDISDPEIALDQTGRLIELGRLSAMLTHELRQPLLGIKAFSQMIESKADKPAFVAKKAASIVKSARMMEQIIERTLSYVRGEPTDVNATCDVNEAINDALELMSHSIKQAGISVDASLDPTLPAVSANHGEMQQVFVNLLANARDACADSDGRIVLHSEAADGRVRVIISDNGPGFAKELAGRMFDAFVTTKPAGTGLGLYISKRLVNSAGGELSLVDGVAGARLCVELPVAG